MSLVQAFVENVASYHSVSVHFEGPERAQLDVSKATRTVQEQILGNADKPKWADISIDESSDPVWIITGS